MCVQENEFPDGFLWPFQPNEQPSNHVEEADTGRKARRRGERGCKIETGAKPGLEDTRSPTALSSSTILKPRESYSKMFNLGFIENGETCSDGFE